MKSAKRLLVDRPRRLALIAALLYFAATSAYIHLSADLVVTLARGDISRIVFYQKIKGTIFMLVTAFTFYFSMRWVSNRTAAFSEELHETRERWLQAESKSASALLASVIAHDVANLLTVLRLNVERVKRSGSTPEAVAKFEQVTDRLVDLVKRLRGASSSLFEDDPVSFDFSKNVQETLTLMQSHICCERVSIELAQGVSHINLRGYPVLVHQLVMNLMINAAEATSRAGHVRFTISQAANGVLLVAEDNGPGIEAPLREKVLNAFFTTKSTGTGLGLTSVRTCVEIHEGTLEIGESKDLGGAKFSITLPNLGEARLDKLRHKPSMELTV